MTNNIYSDTMNKYQKLVTRLVSKVKMSATRVNGFVLGVSGTDSVLTYLLLNDAAKHVDFDIKLVHYVESLDKKTSFVKSGTAAWLEQLNLEIDLQIKTLPTGNIDQFRWADMHYMATQEKLWVVSSMNATEKALGNYSIMNKSASIAPIQSLYKSEILLLCRAHGVPEALVELAELPDCLCGRDEFAASNIDLIDAVLRNDISRCNDLEKIKTASQYIQDMKRDNDFKNRTPYNV